MTDGDGASPREKKKKKRSQLLFLKGIICLLMQYVAGRARRRIIQHGRQREARCTSKTPSSPMVVGAVSNHSPHPGCDGVYPSEEEATRSRAFGWSPLRCLFVVTEPSVDLAGLLCGQ